ncbi:DUF6233 domain-containing protein [Streptomyces sp. NPDC048201]|uniref:DUF6233 domain-containing protein n=1 Tax=Streptomyces sp. NPDC048201 TaxID=3365513 RepID=UPI0037137642
MWLTKRLRSAREAHKRPSCTRGTVPRQPRPSARPASEQQVREALREQVAPCLHCRPENEMGFID